MTFPQDETGQVLAEMQQAGIDLSATHAVVFFQLFEKEQQARAMAEFLKQHHPELKVVVKPDEIPNVWDLDCTVTMIPSYQAICDKETELERIADKFDGYNDGWGIEA